MYKQVPKKLGTFFVPNATKNNTTSLAHLFSYSYQKIVPIQYQKTVSRLQEVNMPQIVSNFLGHVHKRDLILLLLKFCVLVGLRNSYRC